MRWNQRPTSVESAEVIEHLENPRNLITEVARVLRPGGHFILTTPNVHSLTQKLRYLFTDKLAWFEEEDFDGSGHLHPIFDWWLERVTRDLFARITYTSQSFHLRLVPGLPAIAMPIKHRLFAANNVYLYRRL